MDFSKFDLLESRLGSLLDRLKALDSDNATLKANLQSAQKELDAANKQIADLVKTRDSVVARIDALLDRMTKSGLNG
ncbi:MAG: cell division protein ZapB [Deltaproteobacteria bacterium]|nr:cell division protein ZapB [Deltaproteobacteria bacterium]